MLLEDNGLLPFLEDWRFFVEPKIQSNTVLVFFPNINFIFTLHTLIFNPYIQYICNFLNKTLYELNVDILLMKLQKGLYGVQAMNFVIPRRCKTLLN